VAISTDDEGKVLRTSRELGVRFKLISDVDRRIIKLFGVRHPKQGIARPATFIIDKRGLIRYRYVGKDFSDRPPITGLLQALKWL
jgi:peroxiredoxin